MRLAYFDCFSGISGDMALDALVDAGAEAAALVYAKELDLVTFHEFGDVDCLDIVGCAVGLHLLGVERVFASPVPTGMGMARTERSNDAVGRAGGRKLETIRLTPVRVVPTEHS